MTSRPPLQPRLHQMNSKENAIPNDRLLEENKYAFVKKPPTGMSSISQKYKQQEAAILAEQLISTRLFGFFVIQSVLMKKVELRSALMRWKANAAFFVTGSSTSEDEEAGSAKSVITPKKRRLAEDTDMMSKVGSEQLVQPSPQLTPMRQGRLTHPQSTTAVGNSPCNQESEKIGSRDLSSLPSPLPHQQNTNKIRFSSSIPATINEAFSSPQRNEHNVVADSEKENTDTRSTRNGLPSGNRGVEYVKGTTKKTAASSESSPTKSIVESFSNRLQMLEESINRLLSTENVRSSKDSTTAKNSADNDLSVCSSTTEEKSPIAPASSQEFQDNSNKTQQSGHSAGSVSSKDPTADPTLTSTSSATASHTSLPHFTGVLDFEFKAFREALNEATVLSTRTLLRVVSGAAWTAERAAERSEEKTKIDKFARKLSLSQCVDLHTGDRDEVAYLAQSVYDFDPRPGLLGTNSSSCSSPCAQAFNTSSSSAPVISSVSSPHASIVATTRAAPMGTHSGAVSVAAPADILSAGAVALTELTSYQDKMQNWRGKYSMRASPSPATR